MRPAVSDEYPADDQPRRTIYTQAVRSAVVTLGPVSVGRQQASGFAVILESIITDLEAIRITFPRCDHVRFTDFGYEKAITGVKADFSAGKLIIDLDLGPDEPWNQNWRATVLQQKDLRGWNVFLNIVCEIDGENEYLRNAAGGRAKQVEDCALRGLLQAMQGQDCGIVRRVTEVVYEIPYEGSDDPALLLDLLTTAELLPDLEKITIRTSIDPEPWALPLLRGLRPGVKRMTIRPIYRNGVFAASQVADLVQSAYDAGLESLSLDWTLSDRQPETVLRLGGSPSRSLFTLTARCVNPEEYHFTWSSMPIASMTSWATSWTGGLAKDKFILNMPLGHWGDETGCEVWGQIMTDVLGDLEHAGFNWRSRK